MPINMKEFAKGTPVSDARERSQLQPVVLELLEASPQGFSQSEVAAFLNERFPDREKPVSPNHARSICVRLVEKEQVVATQVEPTGPRSPVVYYMATSHMPQ